MLEPRTMSKVYAYQILLAVLGAIHGAYLVGVLRDIIVAIPIELDQRVIKRLFHCPFYLFP